MGPASAAPNIRATKLCLHSLAARIGGGAAGNKEHAHLAPSYGGEHGAATAAAAMRAPLAVRTSRSRALSANIARRSSGTPESDGARSH
jgi:hypothetical protein